MPMYVNSGGQKKVKNIYVNNNGTKKVKAAWVNVNGIAKKAFSSGLILYDSGVKYAPHLTDYQVGDSSACMYQSDSILYKYSGRVESSRSYTSDLEFWVGPLLGYTDYANQENKDMLYSSISTPTKFCLTLKHVVPRYSTPNVSVTVIYKGGNGLNYQKELIITSSVPNYTDYILDFSDIYSIPEMRGIVSFSVFLTGIDYYVNELYIKKIWIE